MFDNAGLMGRLAEQNTGCLNWEPYLPLIFARVQKMFNLPVHYNKTSVASGRGGQLDSQTAARWIVSTLGGGSQTQHYLTRLFLSIESYYHPANVGRCEIYRTMRRDAAPVTFAKCFLLPDIRTN
jgi:proteasome activator subunit 4